MLKPSVKVGLNLRKGQRLVIYNALNRGIPPAGRAYRFTLTGGEELTEEEFVSTGDNVGPNHVDFMIGSTQIDIDGIKDDGTREPVMRRGKWAIDI
jgi:leucyl aminopeptidase (aminopeptidase T)